MHHGPKQNTNVAKISFKVTYAWGTCRLVLKDRNSPSKIDNEWLQCLLICFTRYRKKKKINSSYNIVVFVKDINLQDHITVENVTGIIL